MKTNHIQQFAAILLWIFIYGTYVNAQDSTKNITAKTNDVYVDFSIPSVSAFTFLNTEPKEIIRPGNVKEIAFQLQDLLTSGNKLPNSIAIEWAPAYSFSAPVLNHKPLFRDVTLTLGIVSDSISARLGYGIAWVPVDKSDPLYDPNFTRTVLATLNVTAEKFIEVSGPYNDSIEKIVSAALKKITTNKNITIRVANFVQDNLNMPPLREEKLLVINSDSLANSFREYLASLNISMPQNAINSLTQQVIDTYLHFRLKALALLKSSVLAQRDIIGDLKEKYAAEHWNDLAIKVGVGSVANSNDGTWKALVNSRMVAYGSIGSKIFGKYDQFLFQYQFGYYHHDPDSITHALGIRSIIGSAKYRALFEFLYSHTSQQNSDNDADIAKRDYRRFTVGAEVRIDEKLWLEVATGASSDSKEGRDWRTLLLGNLRYALNSGPKDIKKVAGVK